MKTRTRFCLWVVVVGFAFPNLALATHAWGPYHWARTGNPFTLSLGDNVSSAWDAYLSEASLDWSRSAVFDSTIVVGGTTPKRCRPKSGRVEVCNAIYGGNGWLGLAQIWIDGGNHITQGIVKLNDTYFNTATYNTPGWRRLVMCQEPGHALGLDHQDENSTNANLGSCMDYTNNPLGPPSNEHPNQHDYEQLDGIYAHVDSYVTLGYKALGAPSLARNRAWRSGQWGRLIRSTHGGLTELYEMDAGDGRHRVFTHVIWAQE